MSQELLLHGELYRSVLRAQEDIRFPNGPIRNTDIWRDEAMSELTGMDLLMVSDLDQVSKSFKGAGAFNAILRDSLRGNQSRVVTASAGNHAQGVAAAVEYLDREATIYMSENASELKAERVRQLGGRSVEIVRAGADFDECAELAQAYCRDAGGYFVDPFNDYDVIAGQGTVAIELHRWLSAQEKGAQGLDAVFCPVGGGGLLAGVTTVVKELWPNAKVFAVEPEGAASYFASRMVGRQTELKSVDTCADGVAVKKVGSLALRHTRRAIPITVAETELCQTVVDLHERGMPVEPAGALSVAGALKYQEVFQNQRVACLLTGGNICEEKMTAVRHLAGHAVAV